MGRGVTVGSLLGARGAASGLDADLLGGSAGLDRQITLPHIQKTGLALAGFDEYLRPGRVLVFGESEIRFLERMPAETRAGESSTATTRTSGRRGRPTSSRGSWPSRTRCPGSADASTPT